MEKKLYVIKVGTSSLTEGNGVLDCNKVKKICDGVADLRDMGHTVIIVTSASIAAGFRALGFSSRPTTVAAKQAAAAVGQGLLMEYYTEFLGCRGYTAAQVLLTPDTFTTREKYENAFATLEVLLKRGAIAVINENDTVATAEIRIGDNDTLSAQVAAMVHADRLVLLTDIDGLYTANPKTDSDARRLDMVREITPEIEGFALGAGSANGTGGMKTKLTAARLATASGVEVLIASSRKENPVLCGALEKDGTLFCATGAMKTKQQWLAFYAKNVGTLYIDEGARKALEENKSLLCAGVSRTEGHFLQGDVVDIRCGETLLARGAVSYSDEEIRVYRKNGGAKKPAVHKDNMVMKSKRETPKSQKGTEQ